MIGDNVELTIGEKEWAEYVLNVSSEAISKITHETLTERRLLVLIRYELSSRMRVDLLRRLTGRYSKLRRQREWQEIKAFLAVAKPGGIHHNA
jgi:hypothetical protein